VCGGEMANEEQEICSGGLTGELGNESKVWWRNGLGRAGGEVWLGVRYYSLKAIKVDSFTPGQEGVGQDDGFWVGEGPEGLR
jgi:hypothetical protein